MCRLLRELFESNLSNIELFRFLISPSKLLLRSRMAINLNVLSLVRARQIAIQSSLLTRSAWKSNSYMFRFFVFTSGKGDRFFDLQTSRYFAWNPLRFAPTLRISFFVTTIFSVYCKKTMFRSDTRKRMNKISFENKSAC